MGRFYTNFFMTHGEVHLREIVDGIHVNSKIRCRPYLFMSDEDGDYTSFDGKPVSRRDFNGVTDARKFLEKYKDTHGLEIYGATNFTYPFINDRYPGKPDYDVTKVCVAYLDIEVAMVGGKPNVAAADQEILSIAIKIQGTTYVFSCINYDASKSDIRYVKCSDEGDLLNRFLELWCSSPIDVVTGWFIDMFDIPYIVNRIDRVFGSGTSKVLSPWNMVEAREVFLMGRINNTYNIAGISTIDYMRAYKKFTYKERESYRLDFVCDAEKVGKKLDYSEFGTLAKLYENDPQKFIDYNVRDIVLVEKLNDKLQLLELIFTVAYYFKVSYEDTFGTVKAWETLVHNHLMEQKIVVPMKTSSNRVPFEGGYVKTPQLGRHRWVVSFDFDSLYPHLIMALNISNETVVGRLPRTLTIDELLDGALALTLEKNSISGSCHLFSKDKQGFFPQLMNKMYSERTIYKKEMIVEKKNKEATIDEEHKKRIDAAIASLEALQKALKYALNSGYGAMANEWFLWFDMRLAESITMSGQLAIRYMENNLNAYLNRIMKTEEVDYVIAVDTDSVYVTLATLVDQVYEDSEPNVQEVVDFIDKVCKSKILPEIDDITKRWARYVNAYDHTKLRMKRETIASAGIWTAKKKYALNAYDIEDVRLAKPEIKATGLEMVKSSTPEPCRKKLKRALEIIMNEDEASLQKFVNEFRVEFMGMRFEEIAFPRGVNGITDYTSARDVYKLGTPQHTRAAIVYNKALKDYKVDTLYDSITDGDKIKFCYVRVPNHLGENVLACINVLPAEFGMEKYINYDLQFEKSFLQPLDIILSVIGWSHTKKATLASFF